MIDENRKVGKRWVVRGEGKGWIFKKTFLRKWKAEVALTISREGGRVSGYWQAAREEQERRRSKQSRSGIHQRLAKAKELYPEEAVIARCRQPGDSKVQMTFDDRRQFHIDTVTGVVQAATPYPLLLARCGATQVRKERNLGIHAPTVQMTSSCASADRTTSPFF